MLSYVIRRVLAAIPLVVVATLVLFIGVRVTFDPSARLRASRDPQAYVREHERLHLDEPLVAQYGRWLGDFVQGDWGKGDVAGDSVRPRLLKSLWITTQLIIAGVLLAGIVAMAVGVVSAIKQSSALDHILTGLAYVGLAMPPFWFALLAIAFVGVGFEDWFGFTPFYTVGLHSGDTSGFDLDYLRHLALPALTLTVQIIASWSRYLRASMIDALGADYIRTARAKGLPERTVVLRHAFRNALVPLVTVVALDIGVLFGGLVITEYLFAIDGMGKLFIDRFTAGDATFLSSWVAVTALFIVGANLLADIAHGMLDPRVHVR